MKVEQPVASYGNPQKEDGYTPIANELLEAILKADFSKRQLLVIMTIARMTYGYSRKSDALSGWQIASMTGLDRSNVSKAITELLDLNVIIKSDSGRESHGVFINSLSINKLYKNWLTVVKTTTVVESTTVVKLTPVTVVKTTTQPLLKQPTLESNKTTKTNIGKTSIPKDFSISERVIKWATEKGYTNLDKHLENFIFACEKKDYKYANWDSAFMDAIRKNWADVQSHKPRGLVL